MLPIPAGLCRACSTSGAAAAAANAVLEMEYLQEI